MKTPIQELIEEMEKSPLMFAPALYLISSKKMLEKEKEVIIDAVHHGIEIWGCDRDGKDYYNETFNTKERLNTDKK